VFKPRFLHLFEYYGDLEKWVRGNSSSFKMVQFESLDTVSYSPTVVTMALSWALSCSVCDIERLVGRQSGNFYTPPVFSAPQGVTLLEFRKVV